jgi:aspartate dehydrogenase
MELGLIGFGAVARFLLEAVNERALVPRARFTRVAVREESLEGRDPDRGVIWCTPQELVEAPIEVVVEAASVEAAAEWTVPLVEAGKQVVLLSVGALAAWRRLRPGAAARCTSRPARSAGWTCWRRCKSAAWKGCA